MNLTKFYSELNRCWYEGSEHCIGFVTNIKGLHKS